LPLLLQVGVSLQATTIQRLTHHSAPHLHSRFEKDVVTREAITPAARGLSWTPRAISPRNGFSSSLDFGNTFSLNSFDISLQIAQQQIAILQLQEQALQQIQIQQEIVLVQAIQQQLLAQAQLQFAIDNIRRNTFNALNQNVVCIDYLSLKT
jgi:hypothetical protein